MPNGSQLREIPMNTFATPIDLVRPLLIAFGAGTVARLAQWAREQGYARPFVLASSFHAKRLEGLGLGEVAAFTDVVAEPDIPNFEAALAAAQRHRPDLVIGFGGGSVMDVAKLVAALLGGE